MIAQGDGGGTEFTAGQSSRIKRKTKADGVVGGDAAGESDASANRTATGGGFHVDMRFRGQQSSSEMRRAPYGALAGVGIQAALLTL